MKKNHGLKSGPKMLFITLIIILITSPITVPAARSFAYLITNGEEIDNFKPYTLEQSLIDAAKN